MHGGGWLSKLTVVVLSATTGLFDPVLDEMMYALGEKMSGREFNQVRVGTSEFVRLWCLAR